MGVNTSSLNKFRVTLSVVSGFCGGENIYYKEKNPFYLNMD